MNKQIGSLSIGDIQYIHQQNELHSKDGEVKENFGIVALLDVLGWKKRTTKGSIKEFIGLINRLRWLMNDTYKRCAADENAIPNFAITTLSDTIAILINGNSPYCEINIFNLLSGFIADALEKGFMFRGAISRGVYYTNLLDNVFVGEPFFEAAKYAEATNWAGIIITDTLSSYLLENNSLQTLKQVNIVEYSDIPFKNKKDIIPCKDKLVIVPANRKKILLPSKKEERLNYKALYKQFMGNEIEKLENTIKFIDYIEKTFWEISK